MSPVPSVEVTVLPDDCDSYGHVNQAAFLRLFERARWEALDRGPGADVFERHDVWPAARTATVTYHSPAHPGDRLRFDTTLTHVGETSFTLHQVARQSADRTLVAEIETVFVCIDRKGASTPVPEAIRAFYGTRPSLRSGVQHMMVRDLPTPVDVQGDGAPVLFIHGFPLDRTMWRRLISPMTGWKRVAPDLRGFGMNDAPLDPPTIGAYAEDTVDLLDGLRQERAVICGFSMGGYVALELVRRFPERVRALILANTRAAPDSSAAQTARLDMVRQVERDGVDVLVRAMLPQLLAPGSLTAQPQVVEHTRTMIRSASVPGAVAALHAMKDRADSTSLLGEIQVPTLVIAGREDAIVPVTEARQMADAIPGAQFTAIPEAGHLTPLEQPISMGRVVREFLDALS